MTINLTLCLLSIFLLESIECNAKTELKCYNGLLEKYVNIPRVGAIFAVKSPVKVCCSTKEGGGGWGGGGTRWGMILIGALLLLLLM